MVGAGPGPLATGVFDDAGIPEKRTLDYVHRRHRAIEFKKVLNRINAEVPDHLDVHLESDIRKWVKEWNENLKSVIWTKTADQILEPLGRLLQRTTGAGT